MLKKTEIELQHFISHLGLDLDEVLNKDIFYQILRGFTSKGTQSIKDVNNAAIESYGFSRPEFLKMTIKDVRPKDKIPKLIDVVLHNMPY